MLTTPRVETRFDLHTYFTLFILKHFKNSHIDNLTQNFLATVIDSKIDL